VLFAEDKVDIEVTQGELEKVTFDAAKHGLELAISDSTGCVKTAAATIRGLEKGSYAISRGKSSRATEADGSLTIEVPIAEAKQIRIERKQG